MRNKVVEQNKNRTNKQQYNKRKTRNKIKPKQTNMQYKQAEQNKQKNKIHKIGTKKKNKQQ